MPWRNFNLSFGLLGRSYNRPIAATRARTLRRKCRSLARSPWAAVAFAAALGFLLNAAPALAAENCGRGAPPDADIAACSDMIASGNFSGKNLAALYHSRGKAYLAKNDNDRAIADLDQTIRLDSTNASAYKDRGNAWKSKHEPDRALADYNEALKIDPKYTAPINNIGLLWGDKGDWAKAIAQYDQAIRLDPNFTIAYNNRGFAYLSKGDNDRAIADFDQAIKLDPKFVLTYRNRGNAWHAKKRHTNRAMAESNGLRHSEAIRRRRQTAKNYDEASARSKISPRTTIAQWLDKRDYDGAIRDYGEAIAADAKNATAYVNRGYVYVEKKDYDRAFADSNKRSGSIRNTPSPITGAGMPGLARRTTSALRRTLVKRSSSTPSTRTLMSVVVAFS